MRRKIIFLSVILSLLFLFVSSHSLAFIDGDCDFDDDDYNIWRTSYGLCKGDPNFIPRADFDDDGCTTVNDYRELRILSRPEYDPNCGAIQEPKIRFEELYIIGTCGDDKITITEGDNSTTKVTTEDSNGIECTYTFKNWQFKGIKVYPCDGQDKIIYPDIGGAPPPLPTTGDLNNDGIVSIEDARIIASYNDEPASSCPKCDLNNDGIINYLDEVDLTSYCTCIGCTDRCASLSPKPILGDLNNDGIVNIRDFYFIVSYSGMPLDSCPLCDLTRDGFIDIFDAFEIFKLCTCPSCQNNCLAN